jgi:hypothetical protein
MKRAKGSYRNLFNDIGLITTAGIKKIDNAEYHNPEMAFGSSRVFINYTTLEHIDAWAVIPEKTDLFNSIRSIKIYSPMIAFWQRATLYYENRKKLIELNYSLRFEDFLVIINDLGQGLSMLFARHWHEEAKELYKKKKTGAVL